MSCRHIEDGSFSSLEYGTNLTSISSEYSYVLHSRLKKYVAEILLADRKMMYQASNVAYIRRANTHTLLVLLQLQLFLLIQTAVPDMYGVLQ